MYPVLFSIGDFSIHSYGVASALGFLTICSIAIKRLEAEGVESDKVVNLLFWSAIAGIGGARALYIIQNPGQLVGIQDWVNLRTGGLVFYGSILFALPTAALLIRQYKLPFFKLMDAMAVAGPLGHGIARLGCFFAGCCHGTESSASWAVTFSDSMSVAPLGVALHPTQLYEATGLGLLFAALYFYHPRRQFDGAVALAYFISYSVLRSIIEVFRGDITRGWFMEDTFGQLFSTSQGLSAYFAVLAFIVFFVGARRAKGRDAIQK